MSCEIYNRSNGPFQYMSESSVESLVQILASHYLNQWWSSQWLGSSDAEAYMKFRSDCKTLSTIIVHFTKWHLITCLNRPWIPDSHCNDITWASWRHYLFRGLLMLTINSERNPLVTGGFPSQRARNEKCLSMSWCHYVNKIPMDLKRMTGSISGGGGIPAWPVNGK